MNKIKAILAVSVLLFGLLAVIEATSSKDCITLYVDYGNLEKSTFNQCIKSSETKAIDLLVNNNFTLQGTDKYGTAVLCRLNGLPKEDKCIDMPSEDAYWAILVKEDQILFEDYLWAQVGINELILSPGDSLALVFATNGSVNFPK